MNQCKPGAKLDPSLKLAVDGIFKHDPQRYAGLIRLIWRFQKDKWPDEAIAEACRMAVPNIFAVGDRYAAYLQALLPKAKAKATETESNDYKKSDMAIASEFVKFLESRRK